MTGQEEDFSSRPVQPSTIVHAIIKMLSKMSENFKLLVFAVITCSSSGTGYQFERCELAKLLLKNKVAENLVNDCEFKSFIKNDDDTIGDDNA